MFVACLLGAIASTQARVLCGKYDIRCGECCCWIASFDDYAGLASTCSGGGFDTLPILGHQKERIVRSLGLQRNRIYSIDTVQLMDRFPVLRILDISNQEGGHPVRLQGIKLPSQVKIMGKHAIVFLSNCVCYFWERYVSTI